MFWKKHRFCRRCGEEMVDVTICATVGYDRTTGRPIVKSTPIHICQQALVDPYDRESTFHDGWHEYAMAGGLRVGTA